MALYECPECGRKVSSNASSCLNCGCPIDYIKANGKLFVAQEEQEKSEIAEIVPDNRNVSRNESSFFGGTSSNEECQVARQEVVIKHESSGNGCAASGFTLAIIGLFFGWVPVLGQLIWFLGAVLSFLGLFKSPRILAILGLVISYFWYIIFASIVNLFVS